MEKVAEEVNLLEALRRVWANKGSAGVTPVRQLRLPRHCLDRGQRPRYSPAETELLR